MLNTFRNLVQIRCLQLFRILAQLGVLYSILLVAIFLFTFIILFNSGFSLNSAHIITIIALIFTASIHINRKDTLLYQSITHLPELLYLAEYTLLQLIIYIYLLVGSRPWHACFLLQITLCIAVVPKNIMTYGSKSIRFKWPVSKQDFEWIAGLRRNYPVLLLIYLLAFVSLTVPFISLLFAWYLALSISSFYKEAEPLNILVSTEYNPKVFLLKKIIAHQKNYWQFILPLILGYSYFHWDQIILVLLLFVFVSIGLTYTVVSKYANYEPNKFVGNDLLNALVFGSVLIPFLAPLPIVLLIRGGIKANKNLHYFLD